MMKFTTNVVIVLLTTARFQTTLHLPLPASATPSLLKLITVWSFLFISVNSTYYCNLGGADPCTSATPMYESYARTTNCPANGAVAPCDRYITPGWYTADDVIISQCPTLNSCGAVYPVWMNGTLPQVSDGVVTLTLCKAGFEGCCVKEYDLQIKNCGSQYVYCMPALDTCPERVCFGTNGSCEYPTTTTTTTTTITSSTIQSITTDSDSDKKVPLKQYKDLESRYVAIIVVLIVLLSLGITAAVTVFVKKYYKKNVHREVSQSRTELVGNEQRVESPTSISSNGNPPHLHFRV